MERLVPWRNRMPPQLFQLIEIALQMTLYKIGETGPTSFVFKDRSNNKIKTSLGIFLKTEKAPK